ncbi:hypothetical protein ACIQHT_33080, partial [Bacillus thuringiensis]
VSYNEWLKQNKEEFMPIYQDGLKQGVFLEPLSGVPPAFRKKTTLRKSELKNQKIYHYSKTHTVS